MTFPSGSISTVPDAMTIPAFTKSGMSAGEILLPNVIGTADFPLDIVQCPFLAGSRDMEPIIAPVNCGKMFSASDSSLSLRLTLSFLEALPEP